MRSIYFNDQTKEFIEKEFDIVFLGNLYLKGKPYTNPKEAVDKEYVDNLWDNVTEAQLTKTRFNPKNFPGFNADLVNKEGTNNFLLKELIKAGKYHKVILDNRGRVTGGRTGKVKLDSSDFGGISYNKLHYRNYKNTNGTFGKPNKIADYTNGLNTNNYLYKAKDVTINRPLRLESGPKTEYNIINEDEMLNITDQYFIGKISGQKERSFSGYGDWGEQISLYPNINQQPWLFQRSFTKEKANQVGPGFIIHYDTGDGMTNDSSWMLGNLCVDGGYLYCTNIEQPDDTPTSWSIKLDTNGKIPRGFQLIRSGGENKEGALWFDSQDYLFLNNGKYYMRVLYKNPPSSYVDLQWRLISVKFNQGRIDYDLTDKGHPGNGTLFCGDKYLNIAGKAEGNTSTTLWKDDNWVEYKSYPASANLNFLDGLGFNTVNACRNFINIGNYVYAFPIWGYSTDLVQRLKLVNNEPIGSWEWFNTGFVRDNHFLFKPFTVENNLYIVENDTRFGIVIHNFNIDRRANLSYKTKVLTVPIKSKNQVEGIALSKSSLFVMGSDYLVEIDFKGTFNDYRHISYDDYIPPHP